MITSKENKVKKDTVVRRPKFADEKYLGSEPTVTAESTETDFIKAYGWFNYFYTSEDALKFALTYLKGIKYDILATKKLATVKAYNFPQWIGWNCRLLAQGSSLPDSVWKKTDLAIQSLTKPIVLAKQETSENETPQKVISIQDRINAKSSDLIGELEEHLDVFFKEGVVQFDVKKWSVEKAIKPQVAKRIADHFRPQYEEIAEALKGKDKELVEAYQGWRKPVLKIMVLFIKRIIDHMVEVESAAIAVRKPRKKKEKPASVLVSKMKYKEKDGQLESVNPTGLIGAAQAWVFNTKTRNLSVYNAVGNSGLSVRGSTLTGFDEATSVTKKVRKPDQVILRVLNEGKIGLRKIMSSLTTAEAKATGRINVDTILLKVVK